MLRCVTPGWFFAISIVFGHCTLAELAELIFQPYTLVYNGNKINFERTFNVLCCYRRSREKAIARTSFQTRCEVLKGSKICNLWVRRF